MNVIMYECRNVYNYIYLSVSSNYWGGFAPPSLGPGIVRDIIHFV